MTASRSGDGDDDSPIQWYIKADALRLERMTRGMSIYELAVKSGLSVKTLERYESGAKEAVRPSTPLALAAALDCPPERIAELKGKPKTPPTQGPPATPAQHVVPLTERVLQEMATSYHRSRNTFVGFKGRVLREASPTDQELLAIDCAHDVAGRFTLSLGASSESTQVTVYACGAEATRALRKARDTSALVGIIAKFTVVTTNEDIPTLREGAKPVNDAVMKNWRGFLHDGIAEPLYWTLVTGRPRRT